jgi:anaerobic selenocysteine-containing dehydrogenase
VTLKELARDPAPGSSAGSRSPSGPGRARSAPAPERAKSEIPELLDELRALPGERDAYTTERLPLVLSAGERRSSTANTIIRDPAWRKRDAAGALRVSRSDAAALGLVTGGRVRIVTAGGAAEADVEITDAMLPGHISPL